jgi:acyl transferase domain-containing protein/thioesterase domain-containing protein/acyl carrier protein
MKSSHIAIVGMAGRFPGAHNTAEFWQNLRNGVESIRDRSDAELRATGATAEDLANPDYVRRAAILDDVPLFDASFFGFSPRDASIMDPQHRHFLECAWEALEDAGHPPAQFPGSVGVFAGSGMNTYLIHNLLANRRLVESAGLFQLKQTGNDKDVLATRVSYQLDLRGPSVNVQTACSTSLVAVHIACQSLLSFECDMALAGGVTIEIPHGLGYVYREGEILSRDGHCRSFDASSSGTVFASGLGIVVLRRLEEALADHDAIRAVILGSAINNDGARKVGYLAPSVEGQAEVIAEALEYAGVSPASVSYVEAHGTGTSVGDPIEVRALTNAFQNSVEHSIAIGSLKSNVGHLDAAAGVAGLIKTVLAIEHAQIPPSLHFEKINPHIELERSPFYVNSKLAAWRSNAAPRRAGVTSLGIGGTNAHVVLEEAPPVSLARQPKPYQILTVSAKTSTAADQAFTNLAAHLSTHPELALADVAFTCQLGRQAFPHRRALVVDDTPEVIAGLAVKSRRQLAAGTATRTAPVFLFSGQGSQYVDMGRELFTHEPVFREALELCAQHLRDPLGVDLIQALYPPDSEKPASAERLNQTWLTQPALFAVEYALAQWWISVGVQPTAMVGHSIGEYVAACLAGVFSLEDALVIVAARGRLIYDLPAGSMLAVPLAAADIHINGTLSLAAINTPGMCVVSGPSAEIAAYEESLSRQSIACRRLVTSHAFHSALMDPILGEFEKRLRGITLRAPRIPYLSNVTGTWIKSEEATNPAYWSRHIRSTVRFSDNLAELFRSPGQVLLEVGPGNVLTTLARQQGGSAALVFPSLPHPRETLSALRCALETLGRLWTLGADVDWSKLHVPGSVQRVALPTYPFERQKFWIEPDKVQLGSALASATAPLSQASVTEPDRISFQHRIWKPAAIAATATAEPGPWLLFRDALGLADQISAKLKAAKRKPILVSVGNSYKKLKKDSYTLRPEVRADYDALVTDLLKAGELPRNVVHLWSVAPAAVEPPLQETLERSFYSPLYLAQALAAQDLAGISFAFVTNGLEQVAGEPVRNPARAVLFGPARVIPKELPGFVCKAIDVELDDGGIDECASQVITEMNSTRENATVVFRHGERFIETLATLDLSAAPERHRLERGGVYLVTGGLGALGLTIAEHLARECQARLVLISRTLLPPSLQWESALSDAGRNDSEKERLRKLVEIRSVAGGLLIVKADVTNLDQMKAAIAQARDQFGKVDGVFHAAGVLDDGPLMLKTPSSVARVLDPKVRGTLVLEEALRGQSMPSFVLFSSVSSFLAPAGQIDYAAANAFLDAFALSRKGPVTAINWGAWRDIGMAERSASPHPWLERRLRESPADAVYAGQFSQLRRWVISEHRFKNGTALIPGAGYLEMAAAAFSGGSQEHPVEFQNVFFLAPLMFSANESKEVRIQLRREQEAEAMRGAFQFSFFAQDGDWVEYASGTIAPCSTRPVASIDRAAIAARCQEREIVFDEQNRTLQERRFDFGPRWRCLKRLSLGKAEGIAEIELDKKFAADLTELRQHPALFDMATGCSLYLIKGYEQADDLYFPISYKRICIYHRFPGRLFSHIRPHQANSLRSEVKTFDITLFDDDGQVLAEIEGFSMRRIADVTKVMEDQGLVSDAARSTGKHMMEIAAPSGISRLEGALALTRILHAETPATVIASAQPLEQLQDSVSASPSSRIAAVPEVRQPGESIEAVLAAWWRELLGVEQVGPDDDFFSLGGHSLIGVRLFAKIKKTYRVDLDPAVLFEARTVRQIVEVIRKKRDPVSREQKVWSTLVPVKPDGSRVPLFCFHHLGGDVLVYEPLAKALGDGQPLYVFRSPLVSEPVARETSLEELASTYIKELRAFYPEGPYLLGGVSFGGLVAYEVAQQLYAQGIEPGIVVLFDTSAPGAVRPVPTKEQIHAFQQNLREQGVSYLLRKAEMKRDYWWKLTKQRFQEAAIVWCRFFGVELSAELRYYRVREAHRRAMTRYNIQPYHGKITLIRALVRGEKVLNKIEDPTLGWKNLVVGDLEIHDIPSANHTTMLLDPYVQGVAAMLKTLLPSPNAVFDGLQPIP